MDRGARTPERAPYLIRSGRFAIALLVVAPSLAVNAQSITIAERWATSGDPAKQLEFAYITGMVKLANGHIWVSDNLNHDIVALDSAGRVIRSVTRVGDGPGEVRAPAMMASRSDGGVAIYDVGRSSIDLFGGRGDFIRRVQVSQILNPKGFLALSDGSFLLSGGIIRNEHAIHRFSVDGSLEASWHAVPQTRRRMAGIMVAGGPLGLLNDHTVIFSQAAPHLIKLFAGRATQGVVVASEPELLAAIGDDFFKESVRDGQAVTMNEWFFPQSRAVFGVSGRILNVVWFLDQQRSIWELYESGGRRVATLEVPAAYEPWSVTPGGSILASRRSPETGEHSAVELMLTLR